MSGSNDNTKVTSQGSFLELFEDDDLKSIVSQIEGGTGTRKAKILFGVGFASVPVESDRLVCTEIGNGLYALGGSCESVIESLALADGERCVFSTDENGAIQSKTVWKNDGTIGFNDGTDNAVRFSALETAFNDLKSEVNAFVSVFNSHVHTVTTVVSNATPAGPGPVTGAGPAAATATPATPAAADVSPAKIDEINVP